ncbi:MAG: AraC family ligand binding domain-containing protein, partial [Solobacterium sp.]|nr:AraC family ligand binding domain-containing protein [Solobacterium sp.]
MKPGSITKNRVSEIPYDSTSSEVIYEVVDEARQNNWEILEVKRNAGEEISRFPRHSHMWLELIIPVQGIAEVNVKNTVYFVHPGNMLIIPPLM